MIPTATAATPQLFTSMLAIDLVAKIVDKSKLQLARADLLHAIAPEEPIFIGGINLIHRNVGLIGDLLKELPTPLPQYLILKHADLLVKVSEHCCIILTKMNARALALQQNQ